MTNKHSEWGLYIEGLGWLANISQEDIAIILKGKTKGIFGLIPFTQEIDLAMSFYDEPCDEVLKTWNPILKKQIGKIS